MIILMMILVILSVAAAIMFLILGSGPLITDKIKNWHRKKEEAVAITLDKMFSYDRNPKQIVRFYFILPPVFAIGAFLINKSPLFALAGALLGLFIPNFVLKVKEAKYKQCFADQILDAVMILSSSLKAGLSFLQALEVLAEESSPPMSYEIGLVVRENKMGITLEESLKHLVEKMQIEELTLMVNSILVARETGGDLIKVFSRLATTIRDNRKLKDSIKTLTMQGRMQAMIMSVLPFLFVWWVISFNPKHFDIMLENQMGRVLLLSAIFLQIVGMILIKKFSTIKV